MLIHPHYEWASTPLQQLPLAFLARLGRLTISAPPFSENHRTRHQYLTFSFRCLNHTLCPRMFSGVARNAPPLSKQSSSSPVCLCLHRVFCLCLQYLFTDRLVQAGVGFGVAEHSVKALQIALSSDSLGFTLNDDGMLPGYNISFNFKRTRSKEFGHFYRGQRVGMWLGPDGPHEGNHQGACQEKYGGGTRCKQLTGVNLNPHEQNHSKKTKYLPSVSGMGFDTFTFNITLINELENASINRRTCNLAVTSATHHPHGRLHACCSEVWICGRCFCISPLMRSFDKLGKLRITFIG